MTGDESRPLRLPDFEILRKIGQGGMGAVYLARQVGMERDVALKILPPALARQDVFKERFFREARAAGRLSHPNIVAAIDCREVDGVCYLAMEYVDGEELSKTLRRDGRLPEDRAFGVALQIARGLSHAWRAGMVHRDVKPENFLVARDGTAKLCDLGIVHIADPDAAGAADAGLEFPGSDGMTVGTPRYMSPEQAMGRTDLDWRTDQYSLGASLHHMLSGAPPFAGAAAREVMEKHVAQPPPLLYGVVPGLGRAAAAATAKMMAKDPAARYATPEALLADMEAIENGQTPPVAASEVDHWAPAPAPPGGREARSVWARLGRGELDRRTVWAAAAAAAALTLVAVTWAISGRVPPPPSEAPPPPPPANREDPARTAAERGDALLGAARWTEARDAFQESLNHAERAMDAEAIRRARQGLEKALEGLAAQRKAERAALAERELDALLGEQGQTPERVAALRAFIQEYPDTPAAETADQAARETEKSLAAARDVDRARIARELEATILAAETPEKAAEALGNLPEYRPYPRTVKEAVDQALRASHAVVRSAALIAVQGYDDEDERTAQWMRGLSDKNETVRREAIRQLLRSRTAEAVPALRQLAESREEPSPEIRKRAAEALRRLENP